MLKALSDAVTELIGDHGVFAVFFLMVLESACLPVPSEVIMLFAGYLVTLDRMSLTEAVVAGTVGNVVGSWIAWGVGMSGGRVLLERHGKYLHITPARLDMADRWFGTWGTHRADIALSAHHPHVHLAAGGNRAHAVLALHDLHDGRLHPLGARARADRHAGGSQVGGMA